MPGTSRRLNMYLQKKQLVEYWMIYFHEIQTSMQYNVNHLFGHKKQIILSLKSIETNVS